jgi:hypothetical protein
MQYEGETYLIADGYTNTRYAYWALAYPNNLVVTDDYPSLGPDDCLVFVNKGGIAITVPYASVIAGDLLIPGSVLADAIAANAITTEKIAAGAVTANTVAANAIGTNALAAGAVTTDVLAAGAVTSNTVAANAIGASAIAADAITADKIVAGAVTAEKIASKTITANQIAAGAITADKIQANAIDASKIKAGSVTTNHLAPGFGSQLVIGSNPAIMQVSDAVEAETQRAESVEAGLKDFTDKANAFFVFDLVDGSMTIGKADSPFSSQFSTTMLAFKQNGVEVAYLSNNKLYIKTGHILDILTIGDKPVVQGGDGFFDMDTVAGGLRGSWRAS